MIDVVLARKLYAQMVLIQYVNTHCVELKKKGEVPGPIHQTEGQEAIAVGVCAALEHRDWISTYYRGMGEWLARGMDPTAMVAELLARETGVCRGKGGEMALADPSVGIMCASGIVGGNIPVGVGLALAARNRGQGQVVAVFFGDGAVNTGAFHEALNMAAALKLPAVFICVNNRYAISTYIGDVVANLNLGDRARGYGMLDLLVENANDVLSVLEKARDGVAHARKGAGPVFIEARTFRIGGHSSTNPETYLMDEADMRRWQRDYNPIKLFRRKLNDSGTLSSEELDQIEGAQKAIADRAVQEALAAPHPQLDEARKGLYV